MLTQEKMLDSQEHIPLLLKIQTMTQDKKIIKLIDKYFFDDKDKSKEII